MVAQVLEEPLSVLQDIPGILEEGWGVPGGGLGVIDEIPGVLKENFMTVILITVFYIQV